MPRNNEKLNISNFDMLMMNSVSGLSGSNDLDDTFTEIFRGQDSNSVGQNISSRNGKKKPIQSVAQVRKEDTVSSENVVRKVDFGHAVDNSTSKVTEICDLLKDNVIQHCPICFKKNTFDEVSSFIAHLKGCAVKHKLTTEQLIKAVQLVEKQSSERIALGLPKIASEKTTKKTNVKKVVKDSNMQLAMALSASLRESEYFTKLKEAETLLEAGLEQEAVVSCRQLEDFGFKTSKPCDIKPAKTNTRLKDRNTILFSRSQTERERIITEKVAIILVDCDGLNSDPILASSFGHFEPKSKFLRNIWDENSKIWKKSFQSNEEASDECYYLDKFSSFISPCKVEIGAKLKRISQIPGRTSSDESHFSRCLQELADFFRPTANENPPKLITKAIPSYPIFRKPRISRLSSDYKSLVNNKFMSDITVFVKQERSIYAHKLVFYARCNSILADIVEETENGVTKAMIMWMEFGYESAVAFLEYIYADATDSLRKLNEDQLSNLSELCTRYRLNDLKRSIQQLDRDEEPPASDSTQVEEDVEKCSSPAVLTNGHSNCLDDAGSPSVVNVDGEENLKFLQMALATQKEQSSPEMFAESDTSGVEENVDDDFSLSIHESQLNDCDKECSLDSTATKKCESISVEKDRNKSSSSSREEQVKAAVQWTCDTDVICLSDDDFACANTEAVTLNATKSDKRKSTSPLLHNSTKKVILEKKSPEKRSQLERRRSRKRRRENTCSQYTLSDSVESNDSDESLYKTKAPNNASVCESSPGCSFVANLSPKKPVSQKDEPRETKWTCSDSSFELDDFRNPVPEFENFNGLTPVSQRISVTADVKSEAEAPPDSPVWYGFDGGNDDYFCANFSPSPCKIMSISKSSTPVKNLLARSIVSPISSRLPDYGSDKFSDGKNCASLKTSDMPSFDSFSLDESILNKLESKTIKSNSTANPTAQSQVVTPSNVRKLKARSKSDTFVTPSPGKNGCCVTPIADYSGMKTGELKNELSKYGIKPGLGKRKAKQLLRHIYDQLHPFEDETTPTRKLEEKPKLKNMGRKKNGASLSRRDKKSAVSADSDESFSDSFASGVEELEASFVDDGPNQDNIEGDGPNQDNIEGTKSRKVSIDAEFKNLIREDKELHTQILLYQPIWLGEVKAKLKEKNVKCSSSSLMNYLDEKCVTFRTPNQRRVHKKKGKTKRLAETQIV